MVQFAHDCRDALGATHAFDASRRLADRLALDHFDVPTAKQNAHPRDWTALLDAWRGEEWAIRATSEAPTDPLDRH
jgi:hypothetical protein